MTDQQTSRTGVLTVRTGSAFPAIQPDCIEVVVPGEVSVVVETFDLLGMIDRADPDAMRAYLRETVEQTYLENMGMPPVEREIPEADSPEDVDERPDVDQARAAGEQLGKMMRAFGDAYAEAMKR